MFYSSKAEVPIFYAKKKTKRHEKDRKKEEQDKDPKNFYQQTNPEKLVDTREQTLRNFTSTNKPKEISTSQITSKP